MQLLDHELKALAFLASNKADPILVGLGQHADDPSGHCDGLERVAART